MRIPGRDAAILLLIGALAAVALGCGESAHPVGEAEDGGGDASVASADAPFDASVGDASATTIGDDSPLAYCPGRTTVPDRPQMGLCDAGAFPDFDFACGPPYRDADGGWACGCRKTGDGACLKRCAGDDGCGPGEACVRSALFWGSDVSTYSVELCRSR